MVAIGHTILRDRHLAEDAAQQALAKAAVHLPKLRQTDQFGRWVAAICRNEARDLARVRREPVPVRSTAFTRAEPPEGGAGPPDADSGVGDPAANEVAGQTDADESCRIVREALDGLPADAKEVIYLRFYDGLSYDRISAVLGISEQAINGRLRRAKKRLAQYLRRRGLGEVDL